LKGIIILLAGSSFPFPEGRLNIPLKTAGTVERKVKNPTERAGVSPPVNATAAPPLKFWLINP
jgi:hypothetical protein